MFVQGSRLLRTLIIPHHGTLQSSRIVVLPLRLLYHLRQLLLLVIAHEELLVLVDVEDVDSLWV